LIKGSKDLNSSVVSNENFSKILWSSGWAQGQAGNIMMPKWPKTYLTYDVTHKKTRNPKPKHFFSLQTRILAEFFKGLNSSLVQLAEELWCW